MSTDRALARIQAKLDRWDLEHLRQHARFLADRVEDLEQANAELRDRVTSAEDRAEWWREQVMEMQTGIQQLSDDLAIGITRDGQIGIVAKEAA